MAPTTTIRIALAGLGLALAATPALAVTELQWWHAMTGANNDAVNRLADEFNASQGDYKVVPTYKGNYGETLNAGIAAFRAGTAPHIMQVFEVGTATMMSAKGAIKPVYQLMKDAGEPFDPNAYLPAITGYYSTTKGEMLSFPFNSSSMVMWVNTDALKSIGLSEPPKTWPDLFAAAKKLTQNGFPNCGFSTTWVTWLNIEQLSAWHNVPVATKANGMDGLDTTLEINGPLQVKHLGNLAEAQKDKTFDYSGRYDSGFGRFTAGECPIMFGSSGSYGNVKGAAKFAWASAPMPYYPDMPGAPQNSIIGGASLWVMGGKKPDEYKGVAKFFAFLSDTDRQAKLHQTTGYMPITKAAYEKSKADGFYAKNPALETPIKELTNKPPTENSRGLRLGNLPQMRDLWAEEIEATLAGKKTAKQALDEAATRGNAMLRQFEKQAGR
ncbi:sn-glycerol-3-phosphate ABC transporter substrate-binding protein UgpB [Methylobacterium aquaticum]|uniref:sn-glycerol-3-phosphate ABC transporter substrate-binding protein UgpB n=1 Tax=Methylobacterium aquaticum TaxID=270351 RepID=UPI0019346647|nr:sn-glycerol-3-phosphate ABC transporter substrate-binding protein UgpB [Methylobacterium aquaticum]QRE73450.1 sn-glycerol-3-phosphate ABC transporter substrate-binding protein UgpB [Methylobacterium aquaticum]